MRSIRKILSMILIMALMITMFTPVAISSELPAGEPTVVGRTGETDPTPEVTTPAPEVTTPAPEVTTPAPEETTPAPEVTTPAPEVTTPAPEETTPAPEVTTPAPEETTPAPEVTTPAPDPTEESKPVIKVNVTVGGVLEITYGEAVPELTAVADVELPNGIELLKPQVGEINGVNEYKVKFAKESDKQETDEAIYEITYVDATLVVKPAKVTITAENKTKVYSNNPETDPTLTATVTVLVGNDTIEYDLDRVDGENVGKYAITVIVDKEAYPNYDIDCKDGIFEITRRKVTVKADDKEKKFWEPKDPELTATVTGTLEGEEDKIEYTLKRENGAGVGSYTITPSGEIEQGNYFVEYETGSFVITSTEITVVVDNKQKVYGDEDPELTATVIGELKDGMELTFSLKREKGKAGGEDVDTYTIYFVDKKGKRIEEGYHRNYQNYHVTFIEGELEITKATATVTADSKEITYGEAIPELTATVEGLVGNDTVEYTLSREEGKDVKYDENGNITGYPITVTGEEDQGNYIVKFDSNEATLTINPKAASVTAVGNKIVYGDAVETYDLEIVEKDTVGEEKLDYTINRPEVTGEAGTYTTTFISGKNPNYVVTYIPGDLIIEKKPAAVTVVSNEITYGDVVDTYDLKIEETGVVEGDTLNYTVNRPVEAIGDAKIYPTTITLGENPNYDVTYTNGALTINPKSLTVTADSYTKYYGDADPVLTAKPDGLIEAEEEMFDELIEYPMERVLDDKPSVSGNDNVGDYEIRFTKENGVQGNYDVTFVSGTLTINPRPIYLTINASKTYGTVDPEKTEDNYAVTYTADDVLAKDVENTEGGLAALLAYDLSQLERELENSENGEGEKIGEYYIDLAEYDRNEAKVHGNYEVTFDDGHFVIDVPTDVKDLPWTFVINGGEAFDSHTETVDYEVVAKDAKLIANIQNNLSISGIFLPSSETTVTVKEDFKVDKKNGEATGTITTPVCNYAMGEYTWESRMPVGSQIQLAVKIETRESGVFANAYPFYSASVIPATVDLTASGVAGGETMNVYTKDEDKYILIDENGYIALAANQNVYGGDWIVVDVDGYQDIVKFEDVANGYVTFDYLKTLSEAGKTEAWFGTNPKGSVTVQFTMLDDVNHVKSIATDADTAMVEIETKQVAVDTGAENSKQTIGNRPEENPFYFELKDTAAGTGEATGTFGGMTAFTLAGADDMNWTNVSDWKLTPDNLPMEGKDQIVVTFSDYVGHSVKHTISVAKSPAKTNTSIYVKPMTDETVPAGKLEFYGNANVWEEMILTVGGRTYTLDPREGGAEYDYKAKRWKYSVDLGDIDFPIGVPTTISIAYAHLTGKSSSIEVTYKEEAQTPVLAGEAIVGSDVIWGFVEDSADVVIDIKHADGTSTPVPADNVGVDQFGYFVARLDEELAEGDQIAIRTTDFCGNKKTVTIDVATELKADAFGEILGANIEGEVEFEELEITEMMHRFATPIDLEALAADEDKTMELPILAYKGIEIGKMYIKLTDEGKIEMNYAISATDYIPADAQVRMSSFTAKPSIEELVKGERPVVVNDLANALEGTLPAIDVAEFADEEGAYEGIVWLTAEFDFDMDEANFVNRGGRGVNFYRWLTEELQTEGVLNAVYSEMYIYEENMEYYELYQEFEKLAK